MIRLAAGAIVCAVLPTLAAAQDICTGYGPQTPRDITMREGTNARIFSLAPASTELNLCNIHSHTNAEHKGPGFSVSAGMGKFGGWKCNQAGELSEAETAPGEGAYGGVGPGDTIEVHWVYSSCDVAPGAGLGSCLSESCANPQLRVEAQVFLLVNDAEALNFTDYVYGGNVVGGRHQPRALPSDTGEPVVFAGSTTGPSYTQAKCSPLQVTWSVRPSCVKLDINSLHAWAAAGNVFADTEAQGIRELVTATELLSPIE